MTTVASRPQYGEPIGRVRPDGKVVLSEQFEKFLDDLLGAITSNEASITAVTNQQQVIEGGDSGDDELEPPALHVQTVMQTTVVINHLHMDCGDEDQVEPMFVPGR